MNLSAILSSVQDALGITRDEHQLSTTLLNEEREAYTHLKSIGLSSKESLAISISGLSRNTPEPTDTCQSAHAVMDSLKD